MESSCIWMSAGLVRYKLCDREFDCEHCPLEHVSSPLQKNTPWGAMLAAFSISRRWAEATSSLPTQAHSQSLQPFTSRACWAMERRRSSLQIPAARTA